MLWSTILCTGGIIHTFLFNMHLLNSFPLSTCTQLSKYLRSLIEAALVHQAKRGAVKVSLFFHTQDQVPTLNNCAFQFSLHSDLAFNCIGWCVDVCCNNNTEETCYNYTGCLSSQYCAAVRLVCIFDRWIQSDLLLVVSLFLQWIQPQFADGSFLLIGKHSKVWSG